MKCRLLLLLMIVGSYQAFTQLPPVFSDIDTERSRSVEMTKTYLTPVKILWQENKGGNYITHSENLVKMGDGQLSVADDALTTFRSTADYRPSILLDYGRELQGGIKISMGIRPDKTPVKLRVRFGESAEEAMSDIGGEQNATNDHSLRDFIIEVPWLGSIEIGETGFRFIRIDVIDYNQSFKIKAIEAAFVYRDIPYLGTFNSSDPLLDSIWLTGAYTVHLNMQDYLWDGIKRDRLVWVGDMHPEVMTINSVFGNHDVVKKSLDIARDQYPLPKWMNGISSYSMWWLLIHKEWYDHHGDLTYLKEQKSYMIGLLNQISTFIDENDKEILDGNRFLDWPTSPNKPAVHAGLQAMMKMTFEAGSYMMDLLEEEDLSDKYAKLAIRLKNHIPPVDASKQSAALLALAELADPQKVTNEVLLKDGVQNMSTFYGYYVLEAMAKALDYNNALRFIRDYWGKMIDLGATTFWEDFDILDSRNSTRIDELVVKGKDDIHGDFGEFCYVGYRHSFCHGWASGPTAWLSQHVLGIKISNGGEEVRINPNLGNLSFAEGTFPSKYGIISVKHEKDQEGKIKSTIDIPEGLKLIK